MASAVAGLAKTVSRMSHDELREKYIALYSDNHDLKKKAKEHKEKIKHLTTKNHNYKARLAKAEQNDGPKVKGPSASHRLDKAEERVIELERQNTVLTRKLEKVKHGGNEETKPKGSGAYTHVRSKIGATGRRPSPSIRHEESMASQRDLMQRTEVEAEHLRRDVAEMENQLATLQDQVDAKDAENRALIDAINARDQQYRENHDRLEHSHRELSLQLKQKGLDDNIGSVQLKRTLKDREQKLAALQPKFDMLNDQHTAVVTKLNEVTKEMQSKQLEVIALQGRLHAMTMDQQTNTLAERTHTEHAQRVEQLEAEIKLLRNTNERVTGAALDGEQARKHKRQVDLLNEKIRRLEDQIRTEMSGKSELHGKLASEQQKHADTHEDRRRLHREHLELKVVHDRLAKQMKYFSSESSVDMEEIEAALAIVREMKEKAESKAELDFLTPLQDSDADVKRELQHLSVAHAETVHELEKCRKLLRMQTEISSEYQSAKNDTDRRAELQEKEYHTKLDEHQKMLDEKAAKIKKLQKQIKDIAYGTHQYVVQPHEIAAQAAAHEPDAFDQVDLQYGENLVEICIVDTHFKPDAIDQFDGAEVQTFVTYDFFEHESELTAILPGYQPRFDSSSHYVVQVTDHFLRYLQTGSMQIELHRAVGTSYDTIAIGQIKFDTVILEGKLGANRKLSASVTLRAVDRPEVVFAEVHYWLRFRLPLDQALRDYNARAKAIDYDRSNQAATGIQGDAANADGGDGQANVLQIRVIGCERLLPRRPNTQPSTYVAYQFYQFYPEHCTDTITASNTPHFDDQQRYAVDMSDDLDQYLRSATLEFFVVDHADPHLEAFLGRLYLPIAALASNESIVGSYDLLTDQNQVSGTIHIDMRWEHPYRAHAGVAASTPVVPVPVPVPAPAEPVYATIDEDQVTAPAVRAAPPVLSGPAEPVIVAPTALGGLEDAPEDLEDQRKAAATIQRAFRGHSAQKRVVAAKVKKDQTEAAAATKIQSAYRGHASRSRAKRDRAAKAAAAAMNHADAQRSESAASASLEIIPTPTPTLSSSKRKERRIPNAEVAIHNLTFHEGAKVMLSPDIQNLFVTYTFLGVPNDLLETPESKRKPGRPDELVTFEHRMVFKFDGTADTDVDGNLLDDHVLGGERMPKALKALAKKFAKKKSFLMNFEVVHEPDENDPAGECACVAFAQVELYNIWRSGQDFVQYEAKLYDHGAWNTSAHKELVEVGTMEFSVVLLDSIKALAKK